MPDSNILSRIQSLGEEIIPADGHLYLYGSRARGDFRPDSDWDLLILLNKDKEEFSDFDNYLLICIPWTNGMKCRSLFFTIMSNKIK